MNKEQLAIDIVYAQDKDLDLTPEYWEKKISTLLKRQRQEIIEMGDEIGDELHTHNSIPNYIDNLNEGCPICIKNQAIKDYQTKIKTLTKQ